MNGVSITYDALGRMVEFGSGSTFTQMVYRPSGDKLAIVKNGTLVEGMLPLPDGETALYNGNNILR